MEYFLDKFIVKGLSLVIESEKETSFCLQIKSIDVIKKDNIKLHKYLRLFLYLVVNQSLSFFFFTSR